MPTNPTPTHSVLRSEINRLQLEVAGLRADEGSEMITVADYLLARLAQLGVTSMFGLPGDFNLGFLDVVEDHPTIDWVGNCNELNSSYAADGFARVKEGSLGVVATTFGVGELSAINGLAGAYCEMVPVLHLGGVPSTKQLKSKPMLHHTLGDGRFDAYLEAYKQFTVAQSMLTDVGTVASEIDRVLSAALTFARPVYLGLPTDMAFEKVSSDRLKTPLSSLPPPNNVDEEAFVVEEIVRLVKEAAGEVIILVDACAARHHSRKEVRDLVYSTKYPVFATPMGKTTVPESYENYGGIYLGVLSTPEIRKKVESAKVVISIGGLLSDYNSGNFTHNITSAHIIEIHSTHTLVTFARYNRVGMKQLLPKLTARLPAYPSKIKVSPFVWPVPTEASTQITHTWFWPRMGKFFRPKDVVVTETGTSNFGLLNVPMPDDAMVVNQIFWGCIGWSVGSTLGSALAARDLGMNRTIVFVGDGSIQLTVQELSTMIRKNLKPLIFLLNNDGYTIERYLHGKTRKYNDIMPWKWTGLLNVLGDVDGTKTVSVTVHNKKELDALLVNPSFANAEKMTLVEVMMDKFDAPQSLKNQAELSGTTNAYTK